MTESKPGEFERVCLNPKAISPDDLDDVILGRMIREAEMFYKMELEREKGCGINGRISAKARKGNSPTVRRGI